MMPWSNRCDVCGAVVRVGVRCRDCVRLPTQAEIIKAAAAIRRSWSDDDRLRRPPVWQEVPDDDNAIG